MKCEYCSSEVRVNESCRGCGARAEPPEWMRSEPFEYEGYIVWPLRNHSMLLVEFYFYKGRHLEGKHSISLMDMRSRPDYEPGTDIFPEIFNDWRESVGDQ